MDMSSCVYFLSDDFVCDAHASRKIQESIDIVFREEGGPDSDREALEVLHVEIFSSIY